MIFRTKPAQLVLKATLCVVRALTVDVPHQRVKIRRTNRKQSIPALPCKCTYTSTLHPHGRRRLQLRNDLRRGARHSQPQSKMHVILHAAHAKAFTAQPPRRSGQVRMQLRGKLGRNRRRAIFGTENEMNQIPAQGLGHASLVSGFQPFVSQDDRFLGLRPRLLCARAFGPDLLLAPLRDCLNHPFPAVHPAAGTENQ